MIEYSVFLMTNYLKPEDGAKAYAKNQVREIWDLNKFCKHIASHNAGYSRGMVKAILSDMCDCIVEQLLNGNKIKLGEFGVFSISINCEGAESLEKFTEENIKSVNIKFNPGVDFENLGKHPTPMTIQLHPQCLLGIQGILRNWTFLIFKQV